MWNIQLTHISYRNRSDRKVAVYLLLAYPFVIFQSLLWKMAHVPRISLDMFRWFTLIHPLQSMIFQFANGHIVRGYIFVIIGSWFQCCSHSHLQSDLLGALDTAGWKPFTYFESMTLFPWESESTRVNPKNNVHRKNRKLEIILLSVFLYLQNTRLKTNNFK